MVRSIGETSVAGTREIESKKAVYDSKHGEWCSLLNFERMYDDIYGDMVRGGVAK
jgi:hypothetical protein